MGNKTEKDDVNSSLSNAEAAKLRGSDQAHAIPAILASTAPFAYGISSFHRKIIGKIIGHHMKNMVFLVVLTFFG